MRTGQRGGGGGVSGGGGGGGPSRCGLRTVIGPKRARGNSVRATGAGDCRSVCVTASYMQQQAASDVTEAQSPHQSALRQK